MYVLDVMEAHNEAVRFKLPDYVNFVSEEFDGAEVELCYDSNYGGTVEVKAEAEVDEGDYLSDGTHLVVEGRKVRSNGHIFSEKDDRHVGTVESIAATLPKQAAIDLVTEHISHDIDDGGGDEIIVQTWDKSVIEEQGFMAGTDSICMERV